MAPDNQFGELLSFDRPSVFPKHEVVQGQRVRLLPLESEHSEGLFETVGGVQNSELYDYMPYGPFRDTDTFQTHITKKSKSSDPQFYAIEDIQTGRLVGHLSFLRIDVSNRSIEIGHVLFAHSLRRTTSATEALYLLANKAFEDGYRRLEWKCNAHNAASRRAAIRFGYTFEGIFRQHMIVKGRNRDSAWFSILDHEWPNRKKALEAWLDPSNFDDSGRQKQDLSSLRSDMA